MTVTVSVERLAHFKCDRHPSKWWSIGDLPEDETCPCPWCEQEKVERMEALLERILENYKRQMKGIIEAQRIIASFNSELEQIIKGGL